MAYIDWHKDRGGIALLDSAPESEGINLNAVRRYRQQRVRCEMVKHGVDTVMPRRVTF
jgi:Xaa-Pro dipeptidase